MIEAITVTALFIYGIHTSTREGMLLGFVERFWQWKNPEWTKWNAAHEKAWSEWVNIGEPEMEARLNDIKATEPDKTCTPKIAYPLTECPVCMPSFWGSLAWWLLYAPDYSAHSLAIWPVFCIATAGLCALLGYFND